jgi:hypothetical protein
VGPLPKPAQTIVDEAVEKLGAGAEVEQIASFERLQLLAAFLSTSPSVPADLVPLGDAFAAFLSGGAGPLERLLAVTAVRQHARSDTYERRDALVCEMAAAIFPELLPAQQARAIAPLMSAYHGGWRWKADQRETELPSKYIPARLRNPSTCALRP